jgi:hypothetical protein
MWAAPGVLCDEYLSRSSPVRLNVFLCRVAHTSVRRHGARPPSGGCGVRRETRLPILRPSGCSDDDQHATGGCYRDVAAVSYSSMGSFRGVVICPLASMKSHAGSLRPGVDPSSPNRCSETRLQKNQQSSICGYCNGDTWRGYAWLSTQRLGAGVHSL